MEVDGDEGKGKGERVDLEDEDDEDDGGKGGVEGVVEQEEEEEEDWDKWGNYDPMRPTGCEEAGCTWRGLG